MTELAHRTLAQLVTENHRVASVFEKYQLDFSCNGKRSVLEACNEKKISSEKVLRDIEAVYDGSLANEQYRLQVDEMSLSSLIDYILNVHHSYVKRESQQIYNYLQKLQPKCGKQYPDLFRLFELFAALKEEIDLHMEKEELVVFPRIKDLERSLSENPNRPHISISYFSSPIYSMEQQHGHVGQLLNDIRVLTHNFSLPAGVCPTFQLTYVSLKAFEEDLHRHLHLENNVLFPKALALFQEAGKLVLN